MRKNLIAAFVIFFWATSILLLIFSHLDFLTKAIFVIIFGGLETTLLILIDEE